MVHNEFTTADQLRSDCHPGIFTATAENKELIALNQDPLGLQAYVVQHEHGGYVLVKDIEEKRGTVRAVALYNPTEETCSFRVPLSVLELEGTTRIRDLVKQKMNVR